MVKPCRREPVRFNHENAAAWCGEAGSLPCRPRICPICGRRRVCLFDYGKRRVRRGRRVCRPGMFS